MLRMILFNLKTHTAHTGETNQKQNFGAIWGMMLYYPYIKLFVNNADDKLASKWTKGI